MEKEQLCGVSSTRMQGSLLNLISLALLGGTVLLGLLVLVVFIQPQSRFNPLPPSAGADQNLTSALAAAPLSGLPPTWTPTETPPEDLIQTPVPPHKTALNIDYLSLDEFERESRFAFYQQDSSPRIEADEGPVDVRNNLPESAGQIYLRTILPVKAQLAPLLNQPQLASALTAPQTSEPVMPEDPMPEDGISDLFTPEIQYWEEDILVWAGEFELDPNLIAAVMQIESCGYSRAKSAAGAMGLFQVMPHHFKNREDPYDPDTNAYRGLSWLQQTLRSGGSTSLALAGYNAGLARIRNPNLEWPAETQRYVFWGLNLYQDASDGYEFSYALENWLSKGGAALCRRAAAEQQGEQ